MKISELDRNLSVESDLNLPDLVWFNVKEAPFVLHGLQPAVPGEPFCRVPPKIAESTGNPCVRDLNFHTSGGRVRFRTNSPYIAIRAVMPMSPGIPHITRLGQSGFDLYRKADKESESYFCSFIPNPERTSSAFESSRPTDGKSWLYTLNLPLYDGMEELFIGLSSSAELEAPAPYRYQQPVLYYGSSITQGGCASRPGNDYAAMISRRLDTDFVNLGFSGGCKGEPEMADYLASMDPSIFVCDYDHNAPNPEHLQKTHFPLYQVFRSAHPDTPIIFISKPNNEPTAPARREIILETYRKALDAGDRNVYFIDGLTLFEGEFADSCTVDGCHPNDLGFFRMAKMIGDVIESILKTQKG